MQTLTFWFLLHCVGPHLLWCRTSKKRPLCSIYFFIVAVHTVSLITNQGCKHGYTSKLAGFSLITSYFYSTKSKVLAAKSFLRLNLLLPNWCWNLSAKHSVSWSPMMFSVLTNQKSPIQAKLTALEENACLSWNDSGMFGLNTSWKC